MSDFDVRRHSPPERYALQAIIFLEVNSEEANPEYRLHHRRWRRQTLEEGEQFCVRPSPFPSWPGCQHTPARAVRFGTNQWVSA